MILKWESGFLDPLIEKINSYPGDAWVKLHRWFSITAKYAGENRELCLLRTILTVEMSGTDNEFERELSRINSKYALFFRRLVEQGKSQGVFDADLDTHTLAYSIMALMDGTLLQWYHSYKYVEGPDMVKIGRRMMFHGIRPRLKAEGAHDWRPAGAVSSPSTSELMG
ncbi:MAG: TetR/AcrR family transcriptional regulator C-terminal domain-containing protein [Thermodesulfobacteriota bacterium]|nr:TetR/AcrR family transcriptional regulator C-terminal domain-containing protein [Thermodesulfobacteriota bacterium]